MNFAHVKADLVLVRMKRTNFVWSSTSVCVSQDLRTVMIDAVLLGVLSSQSVFQKWLQERDRLNSLLL